MTWACGMRAQGPHPSQAEAAMNIAEELGTIPAGTDLEVYDGVLRDASARGRPTLAYPGPWNPRPPGPPAGPSSPDADTKTGSSWARQRTLAGSAARVG